MIKITKKAQNIIEYSLVVALVAAALTAMHTYVRRGVQAGIKNSIDQFSTQNDGTYEHYTANKNTVLYAKTARDDLNLAWEETNNGPDKFYFAFNNSDYPDQSEGLFSKLADPLPNWDEEFQCPLPPETYLDRLTYLNTHPEGEYTTISYQGVEEE